MWKIIQQLCEDVRGNLTVYEAVVLMITALWSLRCHDKSRVIPVGYSMLLILYITLLRRTPEYNEEIRYHISFLPDVKVWTGNLLNVILYIPLGGTIYNMVASIKGTAFAALLSSVLCEIIQYFMHRGVADINDVLFNLIGACAGALLFRAFRAFKKKKDLQ